MTCYRSTRWGILNQWPLDQKCLRKSREVKTEAYCQGCTKHTHACLKTNKNQDVMHLGPIHKLVCVFSKDLRKSLHVVYVALVGPSVVHVCECRGARGVPSNSYLLIPILLRKLLVSSLWLSSYNFGEFIYLLFHFGLLLLGGLFLILALSNRSLLLNNHNWQNLQRR